MSVGYNKDTLISEIKNGSEEAFKFLFDSFHLKIYTVARKMGMTYDEAEDVIQDSFLQLWKQKDTIKEDLSVNGLLYTIAKRIVLKKLEEKKHYYTDENIENYNKATTNKTQDDISFLETNKYLNETIDKLPEQQRIVFSMNFKSGLTPQEIAEKLDISKRTVENQIFRARKIIRTALVKAGILTLFTLLFIMYNEYFRVILPIY